MAVRPIYRFHAELQEVQPRIWRRFEVQDNVMMSRLAYILLTLFEMEANHLFLFEVPELKNRKLALGKSKNKELLKILMEGVPPSYEIRLMDDEDDLDDIFQRDGDLKADEVKLSQVLDTPGQQLSFQYDFGDGWNIHLKLEKVFSDPELDGRSLPRALEGAGWGIVEDCGGPWGLMEMSEAFSKKSGDKYEELREWMGRDDFSLDRFDLEDMNFRLKKLPRIFSGIYERDEYPTQASIDLLLRRYQEK